MNKLSRDEQVTVLGALTEGVSIRSIERMTKIHRDTIMRLGVKAGKAAAAFMSETMRDLRRTDIQVDEQWTFVGKKQRRLGPEDNADAMGDFWIWSAIDRESKAVPTFRVSKRDAESVQAFVKDLSSRLHNRVQLSADGLGLYVEAVEQAFGGAVDFGTIVKTHEGQEIGPSRYAPPRVTEVEKTVIVGKPKEEKICTSHIERLHLLNRMRCRRLTRLVDSFSKKLENLEAAIGLYYYSYNFCVRHGAHKVTPAQALGVTRDPMTLGDLLEMAAA